MSSCDLSAKTGQGKTSLFAKTLKFDRDGFWSAGLKRQFVFRRSRVTDNSHVLVRIHDDRKHRDVTIDALNLDNWDWIFGCKVTTVHKNTR